MGKSIVEINHKDRRKKESQAERRHQTESNGKHAVNLSRIPSSKTRFPAACRLSPVIKEHARIGHAPSMSRLRSRARIEYEATSAKASQAKRSQTPTTNRSAVHPSRAPGRMICALARADSDCGKPRSPSRLDVTFAVYDFLVLPCHLPAELIRPPCTGARMRMKAVAAGDARDCRVGARLPLCMFMQKWAFLLSCPPCLPCAVVFCTNNDRVREFFCLLGHWARALARWLRMGWDGRAPVFSNNSRIRRRALSNVGYHVSTRMFEGRTKHKVTLAQPHDDRMVASLSSPPRLLHNRAAVMRSRCMGFERWWLAGRV